MDKEYIISEVKRLGKDALRIGVSKDTGWYQQIDLDGVITVQYPPASIQTWNLIRSLMPTSISNLNVLDLGCNAGLFCCEAALEGANVTGIDIRECYADQANFIKKFYEDKYKRSLNIDILTTNMDEFDYSSLGNIDYTLMIAVLKHAGKGLSGPGMIDKAEEARYRMISNVSKISSNIIIRSSDSKWYRSLDYHIDLLTKFKYTKVRTIPDMRSGLYLSVFRNLEGTNAS